MSERHPLVEQLRFARREFVRGLVGITPDEARRTFPPLNCLSWEVGHLAWQEQRHWLLGGQGYLAFPAIDADFASGTPASAPDLHAMWGAWGAITAAADPWLDALTAAELQGQVPRLAAPGETPPTLGTLLLRTTYHYWYHIGEGQSVRQLLGHRDLPGFVGDLDGEAPYRSEHAQQERGSEV